MKLNTATMWIKTCSTLKQQDEALNIFNFKPKTWRQQAEILTALT